MNQKLRWGLLGTGAIARKFASGLVESRTGLLAAIGSRTTAAAEQFAASFPARTFGSYEALLADPGVDAVYISTPHPWHARCAIAAAEAGRHILCEKPLTMNRAEADAVIAAARANDVFLMEAFMYRCHPQTDRLRELLAEHVIGRIGLVQATFSFRSNAGPESRLLAAELGGGGVLDVGCYCASMARLVAGAADGRPFAEPLAVSGAGVLGPTGVDEYAVATLDFGNGLLAQLACGVQLTVETSVRIWGDAGHLVIPSPWGASHSAGVSKILLHRTGDAKPEEVEIVSDRGLYALEADHVAAHLHARQSPAMSWDDSLGNMETLDRWRAAIGLRYPCEIPPRLM
jgi:predicted dehydrogenase